MGKKRVRAERVGAAVAVSLAAHLLVFLPMMLAEHNEAPPEPQAVQLTLEARPISKQPKSVAHSLTPLIERLAQPSPTEVPPLPVMPANGAVEPQAMSGASSQGLLPLGGLRLGCMANTARLTPDARRRCDTQQWGSLAARDSHDNGKAPPPDIDERKVVHYEQVIAGKTSEGHGPGLGCSIPFGKGAKPKGPPHSLRLGPCFIRPPLGSLTPEADVPPLETPYTAPPVRLPPYRPPIQANASK